MAKEAAEAAPETEEAEAKSSSGMLKWIGITAVLMAVQGAVMYLMLAPSGPSPEDAEQQATEEIAEGLRDIEADSDLIEVEFYPAFNVTNSSADLGMDVHVNFEVAAGVSKKNADTFKTAIDETYKIRLREVVSEIVRSASLDELEDPDLNQLKRRMREDINKTLQQSYVVEIFIPKIVVHKQ